VIILSHERNTNMLMKRFFHNCLVLPLVVGIFISLLMVEASGSGLEYNVSEEKNVRRKAHIESIKMEEQQMIHNILEDFYFATGGIGWTNNSNWLNQGVKLVDWFGISTYVFGGYEISLSNNNLTGTIPMSLYDFDSLAFLHLSFNPGLTGRISSAIGKLTKLNSIRLSSCAFSGSLPSQLGDLKELDVLDFSANNIIGSMFKGHYTTIDLAKNAITGTIPPDFVSKSIKYIDLSFNHITGSIPQTFLSDAPIVHTVDLSKNKISGQIPHEFLSKSTVMNIIDLSQNELTGLIPANFLQSVSSLFAIQLFHNELSGSINKSFLSSLTFLKIIDLSQNALSGSLPLEFLQDLLTIESIKIIDLSYNEFSGMLPVEFVEFCHKKLCMKDVIFRFDSNETSSHIGIPNALRKDIIPSSMAYRLARAPLTHFVAVNLFIVKLLMS